MPNVLLIYRCRSLTDNKSFYFCVAYLKLKADVDVNWMKLGISLKEMLDGSVIEHGNVRLPDGSPPDEFSQGAMTIPSQELALEVACAALANPNSEIRNKGFDKNTPIYLWQDGKDAVLLSCKSN
jgi:hypothetical protein